MTHLEYLYFCLDPSVEPVLLSLEIESARQVQPEALGELEVAGEAKSRVGADRPLPMDDLIDPPRRDADVLGQLMLADSQGKENILQKDFTRVNRSDLLVSHLMHLAYWYDPAKSIMHICL